MTQNERHVIVGKKIQAWLGVFFLFVPIIAIIGLILFSIDEMLSLNNVRDIWSFFKGNDVSQVFVALIALAGAYLLKDNIQYLFIRSPKSDKQ